MEIQKKVGAPVFKIHEPKIKTRMMILYQYTYPWNGKTEQSGPR